MKPHKVCPIIIRKKGSKRQILVFRHPKDGIQIVKGNIKTGEKPKFAALRELKEESGIKKVSSIKLLGKWNSKHKNQIWSFYRCKTPKKLKRKWKHFCKDDGGHIFKFFWFDLNKKPDDEWSPVFKNALKYLKKRL